MSYIFVCSRAILLLGHMCNGKENKVYMVQLNYLFLSCFHFYPSFNHCSTFTFDCFPSEGSIKSYIILYHTICPHYTSKPLIENKSAFTFTDLNLQLLVAKKCPLIQSKYLLLHMATSVCRLLGLFKVNNYAQL